MNIGGTDIVDGTQTDFRITLEHHFALVGGEIFNYFLIGNWEWIICVLV